MAKRSAAAGAPERATSTKGKALDVLKTFLQEREGKPPAGDFGAFERKLRSKMAEIERDLVAEELERLDVDAPVVLIDGVPHRRVLRCEETYLSAAGPVRVERTLYSTRRDGERAVSALELRAGIVENHWTPLAAEQAVFMVAHMTPQESEALCAKLGHMQPSKSSLDRLPKQLSGEWEAQRESFEKTVRAGDIVPAEAVTVAVSLDGVLVPMRDGGREEKRARTSAEGRPASGPAGYQEVGCGTVSFYDAAGERLSTVKIGRMPEFKKSTLKKILTEELGAALAQRPELKLVTVADGANDYCRPVSLMLQPLASSMLRDGEGFCVAKMAILEGARSAYAPREHDVHGATAPAFRSYAKNSHQRSDRFVSASVPSRAQKLPSIVAPTPASRRGRSTRGAEQRRGAGHKIGDEET
ncbi:hypothetical protein WMF38_38550 [Sorangium sp. So ce118]